MNSTTRLAAGSEDMATLRLLLTEYAAHIAENLAGAHIAIPNFQAELDALPSPYAALLLAESGGQPAGCVALKLILRPGEHACEMKRLYIRERFRNLGLGRALVLAAIDAAAAAGCTTIYLDTVARALPAANRLYTSLGFQQVERYNDNPVADVIFFRLALP